MADPLGPARPGQGRKSGGAGDPPPLALHPRDTLDTRAIYRFDSLPPVRWMWDVEHRRGRIGDGDKVRAFLAGLISAERLVIRVRDIENNRHDMSFRLVDVRPAVEQALAACAEYEGEG